MCADQSLGENLNQVIVLLRYLGICIGSIFMIIFATFPLAKVTAIVSMILSALICYHLSYIKTMPYRVDLMVFTSFNLLLSMIFQCINTFHPIWIFVIIIYFYVEYKNIDLNDS